jgi:hypothetical protein
MLADFRSQYPSANALMKLQELLLAVYVDVVRKASSAREFLETVSLDELQKKDAWPKLRGFARIRPGGDEAGRTSKPGEAPQSGSEQAGLRAAQGGDVLPFRCEYTNDDGEKSIHVGINYVKSATDGWYSFADVIASKLLTGKCPEIPETIEFVPVGRQTTNIVKIFDDPKYTVDLSKDDLFVKVIELRTTVKADRDTHPKGSPDYDRLDAMQLALKLIANATSYGVLVEVIVDEHKAEVPCWVYHGGKKTLRKAQKKTINAEGEWDEGFKVERPGKYFAPYGGLIPAAGRLLLAITETLARRAGLLYGFCDTDSMCIGRPPMMSRNDFRDAVKKIAGPEGWFQPLTPYSDGEPLFALEDVNYKLRDDKSGKTTKEFEPLYCFAISAKRYVLFNIGAPSKKYPKGEEGSKRVPVERANGPLDGAESRRGEEARRGSLGEGTYGPLDKDAGQRGETILRKISGHGLGGLRQLKDYDPSAHKLTAPEHIAAPLNEKTGKRNYRDLAHGSTARLLCDIWRIAVDCCRAGKEAEIDKIIGGLAQLQHDAICKCAAGGCHAEVN